MEPAPAYSAWDMLAAWFGSLLLDQCLPPPLHCGKRRLVIFFSSSGAKLKQSAQCPSGGSCKGCKRILHSHFVSHFQ
ncbi:hypothetical protein OWV82_020228 [Melia azedarach]|uniref:Uncharacterized protein n=1 Tax=Melia azedarach TaxID=155640 RepID=A0ACC1X5G6_MELAZ|nr:hypothetical protein OWV82_020228 [Melia azedarach]